MTILDRARALLEAATKNTVLGLTPGDKRDEVLDFVGKAYDANPEGHAWMVIAPDGDNLLDDSALIVAVTGNGPQSRANAELLTFAASRLPTLVEAVKLLLPYLEKEIDEECDASCSEGDLQACPHNNLRRWLKENNVVEG